MTRVIGSERLPGDYFVLSLDGPEISRSAAPGQFVQVRLSREWGLSIPLSIYRLDGDDVVLLVKVVGEGTKALSQLRPGDGVELRGPHGNAFSLVKGKNVLLVTGGVGYAALNLLANALRPDNRVTWLHGGRTADDCFPADEIWTDDGSRGSRGFVTEGLKRRLETDGIDMIYACGPEPMLRACAGIAKSSGIPLEVSLEAYMACNIGACHGCVVGVREHGAFDYRRVCKDGPVFDASIIDWGNEK
jgi:dihydroorotate dehydrogenase electron transfer subunit